MSVQDIMTAAIAGNVFKVIVELNNGADVNGIAAGSFPLLAASWNGHVDVVRLLLSRGALVNMGIGHGGTALHGVCNHREVVEIMRTLLENGADHRIQDTNGQTPLHRACYSGAAQLVEMLLENGADPSIQDKGGNTPLHLACKWWNKTPMIDMLLRHGADPSVKNNRDETPLDCCDNKELRARVEAVIEEIYSGVLK